MDEIQEISLLASLCAFAIAYALALLRIMDKCKKNMVVAIAIYLGMFVGNVVMYLLGMNTIMAITTTTMVALVYVQYLHDFRS